MESEPLNPARLHSRMLSAAKSDLRGLARWFGLCALVGAVSGLAGAVFVTVVNRLQAVCLGAFFGVHLEKVSAHTLVDDGQAAATGWLAIGLLPLLPALGGIAVGLMARYFGREICGGGTDLVLQAYHLRRASVPWRVTVGKWLASAITLGTGGSAGREGPMMLVGGGIGSGLATAFRVGERERRLLLLAGAGAGVGAVFRIPFGSAIFAIEVLYRDGFEEEGIFPCLIASVCGYSVFIAFHGTGHMFDVPALHALSLLGTGLFALVGLAVVPFGYLFTTLLRALPQWLDKLRRLPRWMRPAAGGLAVGVLGLFHPELLGIGYRWAQQVLTSDVAPDGRLEFAGLCLLFALGKIVATVLTVGSGGSGGTFAPSIVAGAFVGGAVGNVLSSLLPTSAPHPAAFALVGMAALLAGIAHVPLAAVVMVCELVGNYELLVPLMIAVGLSFVLLHGTSLYPAQVRSAAASPARAGGIASEALETLKVGDVGALRPAGTPIPYSTPIKEIMGLLAERRTTVIPLASDDGVVREVITLKSLRVVLENSDFWPHLIAADAASRLVEVTPEDSLHRAMEALVAMDCDELVIVDREGRICGLLGHEDMARHTLRVTLGGLGS